MSKPNAKVVGVFEGGAKFEFPAQWSGRDIQIIHSDGRDPRRWPHELCASANGLADVDVFLTEDESVRSRVVDTGDGELIATRDLSLLISKRDAGHEPGLPAKSFVQEPVSAAGQAWYACVK